MESRKVKVIFSTHSIVGVVQEKYLMQMDTMVYLYQPEKKKGVWYNPRRVEAIQILEDLNENI